MSQGKEKKSNIYNRLMNAQIGSDFVIHQTAKTIDYQRIYRQHKRIFDECDYMFERHNVKVCIAVFKANVNISSELFRSILRLTDKYIPFEEDYHVVLFTFTNSKMAYQAAARVEKTLLLKPQYSHIINGLFTCAIAQRRIDNVLFDIFKQSCLMVESSEQPIIIESLS